MNETPANFSGPDIRTIIPDIVAELPNTDREMNYPKKKNTDEAIRQKLRLEGYV